LTLPDVVATRFGDGWPRGLAAVAIAVGGTATLAVQIAGSAVIGETLLGIPGWQVAGVAMAATATYAAAGGMRAGLIAEAVQGAVMAVAAIALAVAALYAAGGPVRAVSVLASERPELLEPYGPAGASSAFGLLLLFGLGTCAQPHYLQKFLLIRERRVLRWMPAVMTVALLSVLTVWIGVGLGGTALWVGGEIEATHPDAIAPALLAGLDSTALRMTALVAVVAAVMSTAASLLNLVAAALTRDLPAALGRTPRSGLAWPRTATIAAAVAATALALFTTRSVALLGVLGWGCATASLLPVMTLGLGWKGATRRGACAAMVLGPLTQLGLEAGRAFGSVAPTWEPGLTGAAVGILALVGWSSLGSGRRVA
jgi:Na+/proline symporter